MINLVSAPDTLALVGNTIPLKIKADSSNQYEETGSWANTGLTFTVAGSVDQAFTIAWGNYVITFTCKASPDESGTQFKNNPSGYSLRNWVTQTAGYLKRNYYLSRDFEISSGDDTIVFMAKEKGIDKTITFSAITVSATQTNNNAGEDIVVRDFYGILLQTYLYNSMDGDELLNEDLLEPDAEGEVNFNIKDLFSDKLYTEFAYPESYFINKRENICKKYYVKYGERYGLPPEYKAVYQSDYYWVLNGGVSLIKEAQYNEEGKSFYTKLLNNWMFLTWCPNNKIVDIKQIEKLFYLVFKSNTISINLKVLVYFSDGTTSLQTKFTDYLVERFDVYELSVGYGILNLGSINPAKVIKKYDVYLTDQDDNRISDRRTYILDYTVRTNKRYFIFQNSLGGIDSLRTTGIGVKTNEYNFSTIEETLEVNFTTKDRRKKQIVSDKTENYKVNTGWLTENQMEYLQEFYLSNNIYEIFNNILIPIVITSKKVEQKKDDEYLFSLDFEYTRDLLNGYYSEDDTHYEIIGGSFNESFNNSFTNPNI